MESSVTFEPSCQTTFLRGCPCGEKHPHAFTPPLSIDHCPQCGAPSAVPHSQMADAVMTEGPSVRTGKAMLAIGRALTSLSRKL